MTFLALIYRYAIRQRYCAKENHVGGWNSAARRKKSRLEFENEGGILKEKTLLCVSLCVDTAVFLSHARAGEESVYGYFCRAASEKTIGLE